MKIGRFEIPALYGLLVFVPISIGLEVAHADPTWIFVTSGISIVPLAGIMGLATEHLAHRLGPGIGGLLNATFGNAAELIIAGIALHRGLIGVVKASITGSIIGNILLVLGLAMFMGGFRFKRQTFNRTAASLGGTLLSLCVIGMVVPALFHFVAPSEALRREMELSLWISIILFVAYVLSLIFMLRTHQHLYAGEEEHGETSWSTRKSGLVLLGATVGVAVESEFLVGSVEHTAEQFGLSEVFVGVILVAIVGNAAEHSTAVLVAMKNKMGLAVNIAVGSSIQVALFVAPTLVFLSYAFGTPMDLVFTEFEVLAVILSIVVANNVCHDGESNWMEGVLLLAVYLILGVAFYYHP